MTRATPTDFDVISFDCYGTLVDWESGILAAMQPVLARHEVIARPDEVLAAYARAESAMQAGEYRSYREVLRRTFTAMAKDLGFTPSGGELDTLAESLPRWQPFPDTIAGLRALRSAGHRLAVISNVDDELFAQTHPQLGLELDAVITAAQARCYKPARPIFARAFEVLGLAPERFLHAGQSRFHDIAPARRLGMQTVLVLRDAGRGSTATPALEADEGAPVEPDWQVPDLAGLVALVGAG